ncbi:MAG: hypothetical protein II401_00370, partial [Bacteroidales bacterium]|nr:hypothetical protein [Bacteroidales bacterium]
MRKRFDDMLKATEKMQIVRLQMLGEECIIRARGEHANNWQDQTGNLRSSIGYMIFKDGEPIL